MELNLLYVFCWSFAIFISDNLMHFGFFPNAKHPLNFVTTGIKLSASLVLKINKVKKLNAFSYDLDFQFKKKSIKNNNEPKTHLRMNISSHNSLVHAAC